jgi:GDP-L-fucose synthase
MNKDAKIYVAGHTGLVGSAIVGKLRGLGCGNLVLNTHAELDLCRQKETEEFFERERPEYVFLAAARVGGIMANSLYKADFIYDNTAIATNIIHSSWKYGVKKLVNLGSSCIYPKMAPQPLKEEYLLSGYLEPTNDEIGRAHV